MSEGRRSRRTIEIGDALWDAYEGSPMRMRDALWAAVTVKIAEDAKKEDVHVKMRGTRFVAQFRTICPVCGEDIEPGLEAMMVDWKDRSKAIHVECAEGT